MKVGQVASGKGGGAKGEDMVMLTEGWTATIPISWDTRMGAEGLNLTNHLIRRGESVGTITVNF